MAFSPRLAAGAVTALAGLTLAGCGAAVHPTAAIRTPTSKPTAAAAATPSPSPAAPVAPLTGLPTTAAAALRPAVSIKVDNIAAALPQTGLNSADLVTEILVEGGLTRLMATYQSAGAAVVGPVRSARPVDADLLHELNGGYFGYAGAAAGEIAPVRAYSDAVLLGVDIYPNLFYRVADRAAPHNLYTSTATLRAAGERIQPKMPPPPQLFRYSTAVTGTPVSSVSMSFSPASSAGWTWNGSQWLRTQDGAVDNLSDGSRITATNVVILSVGTNTTPITDADGNHDPWPVVIGSGKAWVLRNGHLIGGTWTRPDENARVQLVGATGHPIALQPGRTWLELLPQPNTPQFGS